MHVSCRERCIKFWRKVYLFEFEYITAYSKPQRYTLPRRGVVVCNESHLPPRPAGQGTSGECRCKMFHSNEMGGEECARQKGEAVYSGSGQSDIRLRQTVCNPECKVSGGVSAIYDRQPQPREDNGSRRADAAVHSGRGQLQRAVHISQSL